MPSKTWTPANDCPTNIDAFREALTALAKKKKGKQLSRRSATKLVNTALAKKKKGKQLIAAKFTKDHIYAGHGGSVEKLAASLAKLRDLAYSTLMLSSMDATAQAEVLNWIKTSPTARFGYSDGTWTILGGGSAVPAVNSYSCGTVDFDVFKGMNPDDRIKKSRKWLTISNKTPEVACQFDDDGTPVIYHLDY